MLREDAAAELLEQAFACIGAIASEATKNVYGTGARYGGNPKAACEAIYGLADAVHNLPMATGKPDLERLERASYEALLQWDERYYAGRSPLHPLIELLEALA